MLNIDIAVNISFSSNFDIDVETDKDTPVVYWMCKSFSTPVFTIALHVLKLYINDPHNNCNNFVNERTPFFEAEKY